MKAFRIQIKHPWGTTWYVVIAADVQQGISDIIDALVVQTGDEAPEERRNYWCVKSEHIDGEAVVLRKVLSILPKNPEEQ